MQDIFNKRYKTKSVFQHDMVYEDFKDLPTRTVSDKVLCDNALMLKIQNMVIKEILLQQVTNSFIKTCYLSNKSTVSTHIRREIDSDSDSENEQLAEEFQEPTIKKLKTFFKDKNCRFAINK